MLEKQLSKWVYTPLKIDFLETLIVSLPCPQITLRPKNGILLFI